MTTAILSQTLDRITPADPMTHRKLTLIPLLGGQSRTADYLLIKEAINHDQLTISEVDTSGSVGNLLAINRSDHPILLIDGHEVMGIKQNRIFNASILLPPQSKTMVPVSCVEQGRWHDDGNTSMDFRHIAPATLRTRKCSDVSASLVESNSMAGDQSAVWEQVEQRACDMEIDSPTGAMSDIYATSTSRLGEYLEHLPCPVDCCGVIAIIDQDVVSMELFDASSTMSATWDQYVLSYAMDATVDQKAAKPAKTDRLAILGDLRDIPTRSFKSPGLGEDLRFDTAAWFGQGLYASEQMVHMSVFPTDPHQPFEMRHDQIRAADIMRRHRQQRHPGTEEPGVDY